MAQLAGGTGELSIERLAAAVGVSPRTVYVHFPDREALLEALDERVNRVLLYQPDYDSPSDLVAKVADEHRDASAHADLVRAQLRSRVGRQVRARSREERAQRVRAVLAPVLDPLPPEDAQEALSVILLLRGIDAWKVLHDDLGLDGDQVARAIDWALTTLIADLQTRSAG